MKKKEKRTKSIYQNKTKKFNIKNNKNFINQINSPNRYREILNKENKEKWNRRKLREKMKNKFRN